MTKTEETKARIERELRAAISAAFDNGGAFDVRKLSLDTARALGRVQDYNVFKAVIMGACKKDQALWARVAPLLNNPLTGMLVNSGVKDAHEKLKKGA